MALTGTATKTLDGKPPDLKSPVLRKDEAYVLDSLKTGIMIIATDGTIAECNRAITRLLGISKSQLTGQRVEDTGMLTSLPELASYLGKLDSLPADFRTRVGTQKESPLVEVRLKPLVNEDGERIGTLLQCEDVTLEERFEHTVEALRMTGNDLETSNEELQVTNEELEATNDELQSTNEELATTNEELQSLNEELQTTNLELADRTKETDLLNQAYAQNAWVCRYS
ncbi:MAG: PAS domain-containing protein [Acidobacteriaceae bacterium]|nr:PAS domain-containing protein [Acidobacteriaceae bacterium]